MYQFFSKPDACFTRCGDLHCAVAAHAIPDAPAFLRGLRVLFVSDIHAAPHNAPEAMRALRERMAETQPDMILLGGDYADTPGPALALFDELRGLSAPLGMYAVLGNNDREAFEDVTVLRQAMAAAGFTLLVNEARTLDLRGGQLILAGLDDYRWGHPEPVGLYPEAPAPDRYRLLLSHYPHPVQPMPDLMLSGHTHGGQFNALGITPYTIGFERVFAHRRSPCAIAGFRRHRGGLIFASKGIGASRIPLRVGVRPEIDLLSF